MKKSLNFHHHDTRYQNLESDKKKKALFFTSFAAVFPISVKKITILKFHVLTVARLLCYSCAVSHEEHVLVLVSITKSAELRVVSV